MRHRSIATLAAVLTAALTSLAAAQQTAPDSTHLQRDMAHDQGQISADTVKRDKEIAMRDSLRTTLDQDQAKTHSETLAIDSTKARLASEEKASPRDTAAINHDKAALAQERKQLDQDLDRSQKEKAKVEKLDKQAQKESDAAIDAHHDLNKDHEKASSPKTTEPKSSASKSTKH
jgi:hypothetical protein